MVSNGWILQVLQSECRLLLPQPSDSGLGEEGGGPPAGGPCLSIQAGSGVDWPPYLTGFHGQIFVVPRVNGGWCPVLALSAHNCFLQWIPFQVETAASVWDGICWGDYHWSFQMPTSTSWYNCRWMCFVWQGGVSQFQVLPFGDQGACASCQVEGHPSPHVSGWLADRGRFTRLGSLPPPAASAVGRLSTVGRGGGGSSCQSPVSLRIVEWAPEVLTYQLSGEEAVAQSLQEFLPLLRDRSVRRFTDNMTVALYVNKQGRVRYKPHSARVNISGARSMALMSLPVT